MLIAANKRASPIHTDILNFFVFNPIHRLRLQIILYILNYYIRYFFIDSISKIVVFLIDFAKIEADARKKLNHLT